MLIVIDSLIASKFMPLNFDFVKSLVDKFNSGMLECFRGFLKKSEQAKSFIETLSYAKHMLLNDERLKPLKDIIDNLEIGELELENGKRKLKCKLFRDD